MTKLSILIPVYNQEELVIQALESIPVRDDVEVIVCDDGSTDRTYENLCKFAETTKLNLTILKNDENKGVAYTKNRMLDLCKGEYFHIHDSDDYVITDEYSRLIDALYGQDADIIVMDLIINSGDRFHIDDMNKELYCAQIARFVKRSFAEGLKFPEEVRAGDDWYFANDLLARNPATCYTGIAGYHYNFPRVGSLTDLKSKGLI